MTQSYLQEFATFAANGGGASWLVPIRRAAIGRFGELGFPTTRNEDWHFTSVAPIAESDFRHFESPGGEVDATQLARFTFGATDWHTIVFVNGRFAPELSALGGLPDGVIVTEMAPALREQHPLLERHLARIAAFEAQSFTALNTAFMGDGALVHIAANADVVRPIHLVFVSDAQAAKSVSYPRNLLVLEHHARATILESYVAVGDATYFTNAVTEVSLADGATLQHYKVQRESLRAFHVGTAQVTQARDSHYVSFSFASGGELTRTNIYTRLGGEGSGATLNGLYLVDGDQHCDHQTMIHHAAPNCFSRELYKGVLDGSSHAVFNGKVYVDAIAQKTDGKQSNNNLLLSQRAHIDTKPQLEIFADDVKCTHGATVGRIDEQALFYMKSRGIAGDRARKLLTYAFAADVLEQIELPEVRDGLEALVLARFAGGE